MQTAPRLAWLKHPTLKVLHRRIRDQTRALSAPPRRLRRRLGGLLQLGKARPCYPTPEAFRVPGAHVYFGYYDITPFSGNGSHLLAGVAAVSNRSRRPGERLLVGCFERTKDK